MNLSQEKEKLFKIMSLPYDKDTYEQYKFFKNFKFNTFLFLISSASFLTLFLKFQNDRFNLFLVLFCLLNFALLSFHAIYYFSNFFGRLFNKKYNFFKEHIEYVNQHIKDLNLEELKYFKKNVNEIYKNDLDKLLEEKSFNLALEDIKDFNEVIINKQEQKHENDNIVVEKININKNV